MTAYLIVDIEVKDPERYRLYKEQAERTVRAHGGRYLVRGGPVEVLEGERTPGRMVVLEFPTLARAREWWSSAHYRPAKELRQAAAATEMILVQGVEAE